MDFSLQLPGDHQFIRAIRGDDIQVKDQFYSGPLLISNSQLDTDWPVRKAQDLIETHFESIFDLGPELMLIGTGSQQKFLPPELMMAFYRRNIGIEVMTTNAACHTFNILVSEQRDVIALLLPLNPK